MTYVCWMGFKFSHRLSLVFPDLTSYFPSLFNLKGKFILTCLQRGIVYCLFKKKPEKANSIGLSCRYNEFLMCLRNNRVYFSFQGDNFTESFKF